MMPNMQPPGAGAPPSPVPGGDTENPGNIKSKILQVLSELERIAQEGGIDFSSVLEEYLQGKGQGGGAMPPPPPMM
jgi:hypothetical protein